MTSPQESRAMRQRLAAALRFRKGLDEVPTMLGAARGALADQVLASAREHGVPVREDAVLAASLCRLEAGTAIPPELYEAVAEVIAFVYGLSAKRTP
jgi:flagellar biosynthesis protein